MAVRTSKYTARQLQGFRSRQIVLIKGVIIVRMTLGYIVSQAVNIHLLASP